MARTKPLSPAAKRRALESQERRLRRDLDKVTAQLEHCLTCDAERLEKEIRRMEQRHEKDRKALARKLGVDEKDLAGGKKKKATKKKTAKKKAAKKKTAKRSSKKKSAKKKTGKKASKVSG